MPAVPTCILGFEEGTGTVAADSSRFLNHGTLQNGAGWAAGKIGGGAVSLDGVDDQVLLALASALGFTDAAAFTIAAWVYVAVLGDFQTIFSLWGGAVNERIEVATGGTGLGGSNDFLFCMGRTVAPAYASVNAHTTGDFLAAATWTHVAAVFDGTLAGDDNRMKMYVNGVQRTLTFATSGVGAIAGNLTNTPCYAGRRALAAAAPLSGRIDQLVIEPRAWPAAEISWLYNNGNGRINPIQSSGGGLYGSLSPYDGFDLYS